MAISAQDVEGQAAARREKIVWQPEEVRYFPRSENGGRSSMVELQIVVLAVAGSSPVGHPTFSQPRLGLAGFDFPAPVPNVTLEP